MKRAILGFLIFFVLAIPVFMSAQEQENTVEKKTPWRDSFEKDDFYIYINSEKVDLFSMASRELVAIRFLDSFNREQIHQKVILKYGLQEITDLVIDEDIRVFNITSALKDDKFLSVINDILKEDPVDFVSPVFQYGRSFQILTGEVVIKFNPKKIDKESVIYSWQEKRKLDSVSNKENKEKFVLHAKVTRNSGRNVFQIVHELHPIFGEPTVGELRSIWVLEAYPVFIEIQSPIEIQSNVYLLHIPEAYAGNTVRSHFKHVLTIEYDLAFFKEKDIQIRFDELSLNSHSLEDWFPVNLENDMQIKPQFFEFHGKENISEPTKKEGKFFQKVEYVFSISQTGTWTFPPLKIFYSLTNPITRIKETKEITPERIFVQVGSILPLDAPNVNDVVGPVVSKIERPEIKPSMLRERAEDCWIAAVAFLILLVYFLVDSARKKKKAVESPVDDSPRKEWQEFGEKLLKATSSRRDFSTKLVHRFKEILGLTSSTITEIDDAKIRDFLKDDVENYVHGPDDEEISKEQAKKLLKKAEKLIFGKKDDNR